jgi:hypothetical protein
MPACTHKHSINCGLYKLHLPAPSPVILEHLCGSEFKLARTLVMCAASCHNLHLPISLGLFLMGSAEAHRTSAAGGGQVDYS